MATRVASADVHWYASRMTMKRTEKADHNLELHIAKQSEGFVAEEFASPKLRRAALAGRGHTRMTASEYRTERMGRKPSTVTRRDVVVSKMQARRGL